MSSHNTTLSTWAGAIAASLESRGIDSVQVFENVGLDITKTLDANARFLVSDMSNLWHSCVDITDDPAFGLSVPQFRSSTSFHGMGLAVDASATLLESIEYLVKLSRLVSNVAEIKLSQINDQHWEVNWYIEPTLRAQVADEAMDAFLFAMVSRIETDDLVAIHLVRKKPLDPSPWLQAFGPSLHFSSYSDALLIKDEAMLKRRQPGNPALAQAGEKVALDYLQKLERENIVLQVEGEIRKRLEMGEPKQQDIADALNISVRQLQRKLLARNVSFVQLLQDVRHQLARELLANPAHSIVEVSLCLGFNDPSNFASAFKRWEGMSPTSFRKNKN